MLTRWITYAGYTYCVHYTVNSGRDASPWGDDPGWPAEVNIQKVSPKPESLTVRDALQRVLEEEHLDEDERLADIREECKADAQRTGRL